MENSWQEYSKYILITLDKLIKTLEDNSKEIGDIKQNLVLSLMKVKEQLRSEFNLSNNTDKKDIQLEINKIENLIIKINDKILVIKDTEITPLKIKVTVISVICGSIAGAVISIIIPLILKLFGA